MKLARLICSVSCVATLTGCSALAQDTPDRFYQAIRNNDVASLRTIATSMAVNTADRHGTTPLMDAAGFARP